MTTVAPRPESSRLIAAPIPRAPPVIKATFPVRSIVMSAPAWLGQIFSHNNGRVLSSEPEGVGERGPHGRSAALARHVVEVTLGGGIREVSRRGEPGAL